MMAASKLPSAWSLGELMRGCGARVERPGVAVSGLSSDSRFVREGDLFFTCAKDPRASSAHIAEALAAGAAAVVTEADVAGRPARVGVPVLRVADIAGCMGSVADRFYGHPTEDLSVIGVTGTNGKTSVTHFIAQGLRGEGERARCGVLGTLGYGFPGELRAGGLTTPGVLRVHAELDALRRRGASHVAMEVSSHGLSQRRIEGVRLAVAVFTNLSHDHLDYHGDMAAYGSAKARMFEVPGLGRAVVNVDDSFGRELLSRLPRSLEVVAYATRSRSRIPASAPYALRGEVMRAGRRSFSMRVSAPDASAMLDAPLLGTFNASNVLAALGALIACDLTLADAARALSSLSCVPGRMEPFGGAGHEPLVVVDYSHTPDALENALLALAPPADGALWCVFGCGGDRDRAKRPRMGAIAAQLSDHAILTDDNPRAEDGDRIVADTLAGVSEPGAVRVIRDRARAIEYAVSHAGARDTVLVAGKGHESYQEIRGVKRPFSDAAVVRASLARREA